MNAKSSNTEKLPGLLRWRRSALGDGLPSLRSMGLDLRWEPPADWCSESRRASLVGGLGMGCASGSSCKMATALTVDSATSRRVKYVGIHFVRSFATELETPGENSPPDPKESRRNNINDSNRESPANRAVRRNNRVSNSCAIPNQHVTHGRGIIMLAWCGLGRVRGHERP